MKLSSACALAAFFVCLSAPIPCSASSVISGELVVTNAGTNQFRIVDQPGYFRAPSGMPIEALDGKPVIVELSANRQVLSITEKPIHIDRVESEYEVVTGDLVLVDAARGTFSIAGAPQTYLAPRGVDVRRYAGQRVDLFLNTRGNVLELGFADRPGAPIAADGNCSYEGRGYGHGTTLCQTGVQYRCENGIWHTLGRACGATTGDRACVLNGASYSDGAARCQNGVRFVCDDGNWQYVNRGCEAPGDTPVTAGDMPATTTLTRSCTLGGATIAQGSAICRGGVTYRCTDSQWINVGTPCR